MTIGGILGGIGSIGGAIGSAVSAGVNNRTAKKIARENRQWQEKMIKNAHQYEVADLRAAGLNPLLSAGGQGAASGSSPSMPSLHEPDLSGLSSGLERVGSGYEARRLEKARIGLEGDRIKNERWRMENENRLIQSNIGVNDARRLAELSSADFNKANSDLVRTRAMIELLGMPSAKNMSKLAESKLGKGLTILNAITQGFSNIGSMFNTYTNFRDDYMYNHHGVVPRR